MEVKKERSRQIAAFMAFGTKGDVYPIAAVAAAFACDQKKYEVIFISHSAHQGLAVHLAESNVRYTPVSSPPVLSPPESDENDDNSLAASFSMQKRMITKEHKRECLSIMERVFGDGPSLVGDFLLINFFALEGWSLAELFHVQCVVAAPYVVNYTAPSSFQRQFRWELPLLYQYLHEAPDGKLGWKDVIHWMWPLFSEDWASWRDELNLSPLPFTDPVTGHPLWHKRPPSPLLLYGFSSEVVECPAYWPSKTRVSGFWFLPYKWQFSCTSCRDSFDLEWKLCSVHSGLHRFLDASQSTPLVFIGFSSVANMGFLRNPRALLCIIKASVELTKCRFILLTAGYEPLHMAIQTIAALEDSSFCSQTISLNDGILLYNGHLLCFSGSIPYTWLFKKCAIAIHHGGSGTTAAALRAGIPQVVCPFMLDQFYWAERMCWLGVAPEPVRKIHLLPEICDDVSISDGAYVLRNAINRALSPEMKARAVEMSENISQENGVSEAVHILKEEINGN
ncbi:Sterol 3-beta-glucosyltransferase [Bienertia sinuspersici]